MSREAMKLEKIMEQAQVFASAWSLVGGRFDSGNMLDEAEAAKKELRQMVAEALAEQPVIKQDLTPEPAQQALDKKAENARELGLDYEPIQCPICKAEDSPYPKCGCVTYVEQPAQHRAWFTVDELNAWADKKLKENPQWAEQPAQQQPVTTTCRDSFLAGYETAQADAKVCDLPPHGWHCTRNAGHEGPCAAVETDDRELVAHAMKRLAEQPAQPQQEPAQQQEWIEAACALIKAADDAAADSDYMLDCDDCIKVLRGEWRGHLMNDQPTAPQPAQQQEPVAWLCDWDGHVAVMTKKPEHKNAYRSVTPLHTPPPASKTLTDELAVLRLVSEEYNAWIHAHAGGGSYDEFLKQRLAAHGIKENT